MKDDGELSHEQAADLAKIGRFYVNLQKRRFFGKVTFAMQNGKLVEVRTEEVQKPGGLE